MNKGYVSVFCGCGSGKTTAAIGKGISALSNHKKVIMIQFLKGNQELVECNVLKQLEPEMKVFRFEKSNAFFEALSEEEKHDEQVNIKNGINFAKKVLSTNECDVLILDEIFGLLDLNIISKEEFIKMLELRDEEMDLILTGKNFPEALKPYVDTISKIENVEVDNPGQ